MRATERRCPEVQPHRRPRVLPRVVRRPLALDRFTEVFGGERPELERRVRVTLREGQYHQVKRMLGACGASVDALCRERIGGLSLADLPALAAEGSVVEATERELQLLRSMLRAPAAPARIESTAASHAA